MIKRSLFASIALALMLVGCAAPAEPADSPAREAGFMTKPTAVCIVNKALQPVTVFVGEKERSDAKTISREYWYWDSLYNGKREKGWAILDTGRTICTTSKDSDNTLTGPVDVKVRVYTADDDTTFAYFGFNNPFDGRPAFYPVMQADDWFGSTDAGRWEISTDQFDSYRCQTFEWNFNVLRLKDDSMKNWKFEILGPANPEDWPETPCTKM